MTAIDPDTSPSSTHLLSEIGYASLPPPPDPTHAPLTERFPAPRDGATLQERFAPHWIDLLRQAVEQPGLISEAYFRFHGYSLGNRLAALIQCQVRGIEPGPLNTFQGWRKLGFAVRESEKALTLCMPLKSVVAREKKCPPDTDASPTLPSRPDIEAIEYIRAFAWKPRWFVFTQTRPLDPDAVQPLVTPAYNGWDGEAALAALNIHRIPFEALNGNVQGMARGRGIAVSPLAALPEKTFFHEMAHVVLGHTEPRPSTVGQTEPGSAATTWVDEAVPSRSEQEAEAEGVALLLLDTFDLPGQPEARGYIQHWLRGEELSEKSAQRIFGAADRILSAGLGEGRVRFPTVDDLDWAENGEPRFNAIEVNAGTSGSARVAAADRETVDAAARAPSASNSHTVEQSGDGPGVTPPLLAFDVPDAALLSPPRSGFAESNVVSRADARNLPLSLAAEPTEAIVSYEAPVVDPIPDVRAAAGAMFAWRLHGRLLRLYDELHPENAADRAGIAYGMRHLAYLDPISEREVRALVISASRALKAAYVHLETVLESDGDYGGAHVEGCENTAQCRSDEGPSRGDHKAEGPEAPTGGVEAVTPLPVRRTASARRSVGRELRAELQSEKARFLEAARRHGFKVGGKHEKAMLAALATLLDVSVESRRALSLHQWMKATAALETEDLQW